MGEPVSPLKRGPGRPPKLTPKLVDDRHLQQLRDEQKRMHEVAVDEDAPDDDDFEGEDLDDDEDFDDDDDDSELGDAHVPSPASHRPSPNSAPAIGQHGPKTNNSAQTTIPLSAPRRPPGPPKNRISESTPYEVVNACKFPQEILSAYQKNPKTGRFVHLFSWDQKPTVEKMVCDLGQHGEYFFDAKDRTQKWIPGGSMPRNRITITPQFFDACRQAQDNMNSMNGNRGPSAHEIMLMNQLQDMQNKMTELQRPAFQHVENPQQMLLTMFQLQQQASQEHAKQMAAMQAQQQALMLNMLDNNSKLLITSMNRQPVQTQENPTGGGNVMHTAAAMLETLTNTIVKFRSLANPEVATQANPVEPAWERGLRMVAENADNIGTMVDRVSSAVNRFRKPKGEDGLISDDQDEDVLEEIEQIKQEPAWRGKAPEDV